MIYNNHRKIEKFILDKWDITIDWRTNITLKNRILHIFYYLKSLMVALDQVHTLSLLLELSYSVYELLQTPY